jgi:UDP-glucose 4-epimerase
MKKIGVIGANGYIGKHIVSYLQRYYDVNVDSYDIVAECDLPNYHKVNLTDKESIKVLNLDIDYIFMFAGLTGTYNGFNEYQKFISINELGLLNLLDAIKNSEYRPKVIFPSTRLVYKGVDKSLKEDDLKECKTIYAANKLACEGYLQAYHDSFDIPYTIFRICLPYGNLLSTDYSFGTVGFFIRQAKAGKDITLYGGGNIKRTFTHMEDLCYQIIGGTFHHESNGQTYNVGGETLSLHDAAEIIAAKYGIKVTEIPWPERDLRIESSHTYFDDTKIRSLLRNMNPYKKLSDFTNDL